MDEETFTDMDSLSLLHDLPACQSGGATENDAAADSDAQTGNKGMINETSLNQKSKNQPVTPHSKKKIPKCLHKRNGKGESYLHSACRRKDLAFVKTLIQAGISVNMEDNAGWTALHEATSVGAEAVVEELLKAGANVNPRSCGGVTPLHDAVASGNYQVVKLLLQNGSDPSDRDMHGRSAFDVTTEEKMKELLGTFQASSVAQERRSEEADQFTQPAALNPECRIDSGAASSDVSNATNIQFTELRDGGGAKEPADAQLRDDDASSDYWFRVQSHSMTVAAVLEDMRKKQTEISTWPLQDPIDDDKCRSALTQIQSVLSYILDKQRSEMENLTLKYRTVPHHFHESVLKSQFVALVLCQRKLVEILQKQTQLEKAYVTAKTKISNHSSNRRGSSLKKQQKDHGFTWNSTPGSLKPGGTPSCCQCRERSGSCRSMKQISGRDAAMETRAEDDCRCLRRLVQGGVLPPGSALLLRLKGKRHTACVLADGRIFSNGKFHQAPERWLESILGKNIPVGSSYALDKVLFRDKPLSYYFLHMEAEANGSRAEPAQQEPTAEAVNVYQMLKNIKIIHLVSDDEFLPTAVTDRYWDKLLKQTSEFEDWDTEL